MDRELIHKYSEVMKTCTIIHTQAKEIHYDGRVISTKSFTAGHIGNVTKKSAAVDTAFIIDTYMLSTGTRSHSNKGKYRDI